MIEEITQAMNEKQQVIKEIQEEMEEEFPYLRQLEVKDYAEHSVPQVEQPTESAERLVCLFGQALPST